MSLRPITIAGGGLAGLSLGRALAAEGLQVTLHEAGDYPRHKVCGEFVTGLCELTRSRLGLAPFLSDARPLHHMVWYRRGRRLTGWTLPQVAEGISRHQLDRALAAAFVANGGRLVTGSRFRLPQGKEGAEAEGLVQATGRLPSGRGARSPRWIGLKAHLLPPFSLASDLEIHLGDGGYVGLSPVEDGRINCCGLFRQRPQLRPGPERPLLEAYLAASGLSTLEHRLRAATVDPGSRSAVAGLDYWQEPAPRAWVRLGDSHGLIPPYTGHGMAMAFESAGLALAPLLAYARGELAWAAALEVLEQAHRRRFGERLRRARQLHPLLYRGPWQGGLALLARSRLLPLDSLYRLTHR